MTVASADSQRFPKTARLLKKRDFTFNTFTRHATKHFLFICSPDGKGRLGVSISKKILRKAPARNRVKRLLREAFRLDGDRLKQCDVHAIGLAALTTDWVHLNRQDVSRELSQVGVRK